MNRQPAPWVLALAALAAFGGYGRRVVSAAAADAHAIMAAVYAQDGSHDTSARASFEVFDQDGHRAQKSFTYRRIGTPANGRTLLVFTDPLEVRGVALLSIDQPGSSASQYLYTPASQRTRRVVPQQLTARFLGTDFSFEDLQGHALEDFSYRLLDGGEVLDGHRTQKIEATAVNAANSQYRLIEYWIAQDVPVIVRAELFDQQGMRVRIERASDLRRVGGIWGARRTEMQTVNEGTRTVLTIHEIKFNSGLDAGAFTPEALETVKVPTGSSR